MKENREQKIARYGMLASSIMAMVALVLGFFDRDFMIFVFVILCQYVAFLMFGIIYKIRDLIREVGRRSPR